MDFEILQTAAKRGWDRLHLADQRDVLGIGEGSTRSATEVAA